jgi:spermidine synthase
MNPFPLLVYLTILVVATCGLIYEFIAGTLTSYLLGNSITQFSIVIGVFLSALGLGAWLSRFVQREVARRFIEVELSAALIGGLSTPVLFASFARPSTFLAAMYSVVIIQATLVGLEVPLILRMLRRRVEFRDLVARALAFDYLGSLTAGVLFSLVLLPHLGLVRTGVIFGFINANVGLSGTWLFAPMLGPTRNLRIKAVAVMSVLTAVFGFSERLTRAAESLLFADPVVYARQSRFQRIVLTSGRGAFHLFLDGNLQFSSADEYRYHEALVHPVFEQTPRHDKVLILGGGDGLAVREVLRHPEVQSITLVDIDPVMTDLASHHPVFVALNQQAMTHPRVRVVNDDAMAWLSEGSDLFDIVIIDFPDPNNYTLGKLYTTRFYRTLQKRLHPDGALVVQATSPLVARQSFWCVVQTMEASGFQTLPYHALVPSFGEWGYVLASYHPLRVPERAPLGLRYLDSSVVSSLFRFSPDMSRVPAEVNRLNNQVLVRYYDAEWRKLL